MLSRKQVPLAESPRLRESCSSLGPTYARNMSRAGPHDILEALLSRLVNPAVLTFHGWRFRPEASKYDMWHRE